jgi:DNA-binding MarR family transcriptional regulator
MTLRTAYMALHRETDAVLASRGVTADQFVVLSALAESEAPTQRDLVLRTSSDPSTLRAMLVLLEKGGLVERRPHPTDGRARSVRLTGRGRRTLSRTWKGTEPVRQRLATALSRREIDDLVASLNKIAILVPRSPIAEVARTTTKGAGRRRLR